MSWFDKPDETAPAVEDALTLARRSALPVTARSHTKAFYAARYRKFGLIFGAVYSVLAGLILLGLLLDGGQDSAVLTIVAPSSLIGGVAVHLAIRWHMRRHGDYRDPGIAVDVGADGIVARGAGGDRRLRWQEIEASVNWLKIKGSVYFVGLWLQSPLGPVDLREESYRGGRLAAALIVQGMQEAYHARQRAKVERIG